MHFSFESYSRIVFCSATDNSVGDIFCSATDNSVGDIKAHIFTGPLLRLLVNFRW